ncbi:MAG: thymidine phosphorylase, partial [Lachnospiraceae bacterium]|nr:thymidine phosphorylase [Lachnospiraceae bacterium]
MLMVDIIRKKRDGGSLTKEEIDFFINGYVKGEIPDYQVSALMMAIFFKGMNDEETGNLTLAMLHSGEKLDLSSIKGFKVDKHSTGGVGDKTSLVLTPMVAACNVPVAKMSGRGLGHTGGTIDKLESFKGFSTAISNEQFINNVNTVGISIMGQTKDLAPADKLLYALRDVTATVDNMSLIASSIMSKKLAAGADGIVLDVKSGSGAFMKNDRDAFELAEKMVAIGKHSGVKTMA